MATSSFVQPVNLKLVKKGRKYWTCIQHWEGHGKKRDYEVKMLIDDSNKDLEPGVELTDYLVRVEKETSRYGTKHLLVPIDEKQYQAEHAKAIFERIKTKWEDEDFIPSASDIEYIEEQRDSLGGQYSGEIKELIRKGVIRRNVMFLRQQFADDMYINEKRIDNLHHLGCFDYDDEIEAMREKKEEAKKAKREVEKAKRQDWLKTHFVRTIQADSKPRPKIGSIDVIFQNDHYRAGKCISSQFASDEDNIWTYGDIYYAEYEDISDTEEGQKAIENYKAQKLVEEQERKRVRKLRKSLDELGNWIKDHDQLAGSRVNLDLDVLDVIFDDQNIYGGGETIAVDSAKKQIWYVIHHHADGDDWSANNIYFSKDAPDSFGDAIGYMADFNECQAMIDRINEMRIAP